VDTELNTVSEEQLKVEETDDSCRVDFIEIVPLARDMDGSCTTECVDGDWLGEVREVEFTDLKQEPKYVCDVLSAVFSVSHYKEVVQFLGNRWVFETTRISLTLIGAMCHGEMLLVTPFCIHVLCSPILVSLLYGAGAVSVSQTLQHGVIGMEHGTRNGITALLLLVILNRGRYLYFEGGYHVGHRPTF